METMNTLSDTETSLSHHLVESSKRAKRALADFQKMVGEKGKNAVRQTDECIHDHPWEAVALGLVLGTTVGFLLGRRW